MTATQDLIAAALTAADKLDIIGGHFSITADGVRELCARAMVQPDIAEVERLVDEYADSVIELERERKNKYLSAQRDTDRAALLDAVRAIAAERDALRDAAKMVPEDPTPAMLDAAGRIDWSDSDERGNCVKLWHVMLAAAPQPVGEVADLISRQQSIGPEIGRVLADNMDALVLASNPVGEVPMPEPDIMHTGTDGELYGYWNEYQMIHYGDACKEAGYAAGVAAGDVPEADFGNMLNCRTCAHFTADGCNSTVMCMEADQYKATGPRRYWATMSGEVKP